MIAVIFEVLPHPDCRSAYFDAAATLRPQLENIDGFMSIERFGSLSSPGKILSLSFWRDEEAVRQWRTLEAHREMQALGRELVFAEYRLRVAQVVIDKACRTTLYKNTAYQVDIESLLVHRIDARKTTVPHRKRASVHGSANLKSLQPMTRLTVSTKGESDEIFEKSIRTHVVGNSHHDRTGTLRLGLRARQIGVDGLHGP